MDTIKCPYCECSVRMTDVDAEGGTCPECGAMLTGSRLFDDINDLEDMDDDDIIAPSRKDRDDDYDMND